MTENSVKHLNLFKKNTCLLTNFVLCVRPQYSQKEDKYEEEIKVLTDKLKEVSYLQLV